MGLRAKPSVDINDTAMLSGKISLPVVYFRKVPSACESNDRISFFRKSRHCLSASLLGLHSIDLKLSWLMVFLMLKILQCDRGF